MSTIVFIGDEVSAAGYRLCGVRVLCPAAHDVAEIVRRTRSEAPGLVLLGHGCSTALADEELQQMLLEQRPPMLVVGDVRGKSVPADLAAYVRRQLGLPEQP